MLKENTKAPDFELLDEDGTSRKLSDYRGAPLVLYFYPKDNTPGCTTEACNFRDNYSDYQTANVTIVGISTDSVKSHKKFKEKYQLPFPLLSDPEHVVCEKYGVWSEKQMMGKKYMGILRTTFVINKDGSIAKIFEGVKPTEHSKEVLEVVKKL
ncbi:MAG TPA: thioredoxin-dependent thiol peroxidase [Anaerolineaceae bacterium]|uniref:thioredoxin-dependent peroxiredoxin n=1 Tax=Anaerolinea thermophila TaxID=167964 RepID=A0A101FYB0_9CHLR|nr:MAG: Putative peroxiredoxin [Anaerolinea thermophila]HAF62104.1 thioredoxin-dependent thiol peroxidase [Anaerolineaceae bacterium]